ncbi:aldo/keto reductase [Halocatena halophila]|uniref:aldo/keto reductase n=1 Tax=Halocatena halophila TaxID=2814576 RepID=UPI002ED2F5E0
METRPLGSTTIAPTVIGLGTWNVGPVWGDVSDSRIISAIETALDEGITFLDTAEVYGDGRAERLIGSVLAGRDRAEIDVVTKAKPDPDGGHSRDGLRASVTGSLDRLGVNSLDLVQLHCPDTPAYYDPSVFETLESLREEGVIDHAGVSVELVEQAQKAIEYDVIESVQIIFNPFRLRPREWFFEAAAKHDVGVIVRVPLASGLLADAFDGSSTFDADDHRRGAIEAGVTAGVGTKGGETFAGVPFDAGIEAVNALRAHVPEAMTMAQFTLRWILDHDAVTTVIPGSTSPEHVAENVAAASFEPLSHEVHGAVTDIYQETVKGYVHHRW